MQRRQVFEFWSKESSCSQLNMAMYLKKKQEEEEEEEEEEVDKAIWIVSFLPNLERGNVFLFKISEFWAQLVYLFS